MGFVMFLDLKGTGKPCLPSRGQVILIDYHIIMMVTKHTDHNRTLRKEMKINIMMTMTMTMTLTMTTTVTVMVSGVSTAHYPRQPTTGRMLFG